MLKTKASNLTTSMSETAEEKIARLEAALAAKDKKVKGYKMSTVVTPPPTPKVAKAKAAPKGKEPAVPKPKAAAKPKAANKKVVVDDDADPDAGFVTSDHESVVEEKPSKKKNAKAAKAAPKAKGKRKAKAEVSDSGSDSDSSSDSDDGSSSDSSEGSDGDDEGEDAMSDTDRTDKTPKKGRAPRSGLRPGKLAITDNRTPLSIEAANKKLQIGAEILHHVEFATATGVYLKGENTESTLLELLSRIYDRVKPSPPINENNLKEALKLLHEHKQLNLVTRSTPMPQFDLKYWVVGNNNDTHRHTEGTMIIPPAAPYDIANATKVQEALDTWITCSDPQRQQMLQSKVVGALLAASTVSFVRQPITFIVRKADTWFLEALGCTKISTRLQLPTAAQLAIASKASTLWVEPMLSTSGDFIDRLTKKTQLHTFIAVDSYPPHESLLRKPTVVIGHLNPPAEGQKNINRFIRTLAFNILKNAVESGALEIIEGGAQGVDSIELVENVQLSMKMINLIGLTEHIPAPPKAPKKPKETDDTAKADGKTKADKEPKEAKPKKAAKNATPAAAAVVESAKEDSKPAPVVKEKAAVAEKSKQSESKPVTSADVDAVMKEASKKSSKGSKREDKPKSGSKRKKKEQKKKKKSKKSRKSRKDESSDDSSDSSSSSSSSSESSDSSDSSDD